MGIDLGVVTILWVQGGKQDLTNSFLLSSAPIAESFYTVWLECSADVLSIYCYLYHAVMQVILIV